MNRSNSKGQQAYGGGITHLFDERSRIWTRVEHFYRYPATDEIAGYNGWGPATFNTNLKPQNGNTIELGGDYKSGNWKFTTTLFGTQIKDEIFFSNISFSNTNFSERTVRYGFETEVAYDQKMWGVALQYRNTTAEEDSGKNKGQRISLVPNHQLQLRGTVRPIEKLELFALTRYRGSFDSDSGGLGQQTSTGTLVNMGGVFTHNLGFRYEVIRNCDLFGNIDNVTDKSYTNNVIWGAYYPEAGRTVNGGVRYRF